MDISIGQQKRAEKIERMRRYFPVDHPKIYQWTPVRDESIDFKSMTDEQIAAYLKEE